MCEIERTLRGRANTPHTEHNREKVEEHKLEIQEILGVPDSQSLPLDQYSNVTESATPVVPVASSSTITISSGAPLVLPAEPDGILIATRSVPLLNFTTPACKRLASRAFVLCELSSLIEALFSSELERNAVRSLRGDDAQTFIDVLDEVCPYTPP